MDQQYPYLEICPKCGKHGIILLSGTSKSMGFMTKQIGFSVANFYHDKKWITESDYQKLYQDVSQSSLSQSDEPESARDEVTQMRLILIYEKTQRGAKLVEPYFPCGDADPQLYMGTIGDFLKVGLN